LTRNEQTTKKNIESIHKIESDLKGVSETLSKVEELVRKNSEEINSLKSNLINELQMEVGKLKRRVKILSVMTLGAFVSVVLFILLLL
jgi:archaellum component FlaC